MGRPSQKNLSVPRQPQPPREPVAPGRSGRGADSALRHLREWERRRAAGRGLPERDKPSRG